MSPPPPDGAQAALRTVPPVSVEAQLLRAKLVTADQISEAMRIEAETGTAVARIVLERGWATKEQLEEALGPPDGDDQDHPTPAPELVPPPEPAEPEAPELPPAAKVRVVVRLADGELRDAGTFAGDAEARARARALVSELGDGDAWPFVAGKPLDAAEVDSIFLLRE